MTEFRAREATTGLTDIPCLVYGNGVEEENMLKV